MEIIIDLEESHFNLVEKFKFIMRYKGISKNYVIERIKAK